MWKKRPQWNYAFIDNENVNVSTQRLGWKLDWWKFLRWLKKDFWVTKAFLFMWYIPEYQKMYDFFESLWYELIFKKIHLWDNIPNKGNIDAELVLHTMAKKDDYHQAIIVSGDWDFSSLVDYLHTHKKLRCVIWPNKKRSSDFLQESADGRFLYLDWFKKQLWYTWYTQKKWDSSADREEPFWM